MYQYKSESIEKITSLTKRPYQKEAIKSIIEFVKNLIQGSLECSDQKYENAGLIEMATGSGKTFTIGKALELLLKLRNKYNTKDFSKLNVLVLTNRIGGLEQFRDDLVHGRQSENKLPIINSRLLENITISTFHSKADDLDGYISGENTDKENDGKNHDNFYFSTFQTANLKAIDEKIPYFDIIIIDETHNVKQGNDFESLIDKLSIHGRNGRNPIIIPITATPTNLTQDLFGEPQFSYPLAEYLASEYSPSVEYKLITNSKASQEDIIALKLMIEDAKQIKDYKDKKELLKEVNERFNKLMLQVPSLTELVDDLLIRLISEDEDIKETVLFANSIDEANKIAQEINLQYGDNIALAYHSKSDRKGLEKLRDSNNPTKIIVAVDMLNESIDLPTVSNVVFWRGTDVARIFLQQFGRGLRGDGLVRYFDYVGSMANFSWVGNIYEEFKEKVGGKGDDTGGDGLEGGEKFKLLGGNTGIGDHQIDLSSLGFDILKLENDLHLKTLDDYQRYFEENIDEFKTFGCIFSEEDGVKKVDLNNIGSPNNINLFGKRATSGLRNLNMVLGNNNEGEIQNKITAKKVLKQFFESFGYIIDIEEKKELKILDDYKKYFEENIDEFKTFGCIFSEEDGLKKVDLNNIGKPSRFKLFGKVANSGLKNLNIALGSNDKLPVENKANSQKVLKQFFESLWYEVCFIEEKEKIELETIKDYQRYFEENIKEFETFGCIFNKEDGIKKVNLNNISSPNRINLFGKLAINGLKNLSIALGNKNEGEVKSKPVARKILKQFFESLNYIVDLEEENIKIELKTLEDYKKYFKEHKTEFETFGCLFIEENGIKKVDLNNIGIPQEFKLFGKQVPAGIRNLNIAIGNSDEGPVMKKSTAQKILKQFFEFLGFQSLSLSKSEHFYEL